MTVDFRDPGKFTAYLTQIEDKASPILDKILAFNAAHQRGEMMMTPESMRLLCWLAHLIGTKNYLELGVFTGYSSTAMALSLPPCAQLYLCDINVTYTDAARRFWAEAKVESRCHLYLQPALITLREFEAEGKVDFFDFVLLDADKDLTALYVDACYALLRPGGIIAIDNTYQRGLVAKAAGEADSQSLRQLRRFNRDIFTDSRFSAVMLPLGDGLTLLEKVRE